MSNNRTEDLKQAINIVVAVVRNIHMKNALHSACNDPTLNFWRIIYGNLLDMAVLEWSKLFGSDNKDHQPVHWKNMVPSSDHIKFLIGLHEYLDINAEEWREYWETIKKFRDTNVAHWDYRQRDVTHYPVLETALRATYYYYKYLNCELRYEGFVDSPNDISEYSDKFSKQTTEVAECALQATSAMEEKVG